MSAFALKIVAMIAMFIDHISYVIYNGNVSWLNYIGRLAFPIFAFQISEGYIHTKNLKKYFFRLFLFAIISQIPYLLFLSSFTKIQEFDLNIFFTLFLGLIAIFLYDKCSNKPLVILLELLLACSATLLHFDYGWYGIVIILTFYIFKNNTINASILFIFATVIKYFPYVIDNSIPNILLCVFTCIPVFFILAYNGKKGKSTKLFLYFFYPVHLLLIYGISLIIH